MKPIGIGASASCGGVNMPKVDRDPEVNRWIGQLGFVTERLNNLAFTLEERLTPVCGYSEPESCNDKEEQAAAPLASAIQAQVIALSAAENRILRLLRRLEI